LRGSLVHPQGFQSNRQCWIGGGGGGINTPFKDVAEMVEIYDFGMSKAPSIFKSVSFDLINLSNVIEHVGNPFSLLGNIRKFMKEGTFLYVETPLERIMEDSENLGVEPDLKKKRHWHEHVNFFSEKSLEYLFTRSKLEVINRIKFRESAWGNWNFFQAFVLKRS
jgi:2-polyprenyl-3-methyl-5-hydroxy-6-metoxy-1,4-benzoquinol methylase